MKCPICRTGEASEGTTTVTLERGEVTVVFKDVPARVCDNCGEDYVDDAVAARLLEALDQADQAGVVTDVRRFAAA